MAFSQKFLLINLSIIVINAGLGIFLHLMLLSRQAPIRERYVQLPDDILIDDPQIVGEIGVTDLPVFNETEGCSKTAERKTLTLDPTRGMLDQSRHFLTHSFAMTGEMWQDVTKSWNICLSTQTSADLLFWLSKQAKVWTGPISVSVFTPDLEYTIALKMINYLQTCFPEIRQRVSFHITYSKKMPPTYAQRDKNDHKEYDCEKPEEVNKALVQQFRSRQLKDLIRRMPYPQNLLRNIARKGCPNEFAFTPDVDMILVPGMAEQLNEFISRNSTRLCNKCAFLIPTYEIHKRVTTNPVDKNELNELLKRKLAQRFHARAFAPNQANSQLNKWETEGMTEKLEIIYNVTTWKSYWEPMYVSKAEVPLYDERFIGYGFTRSSQVFEMHVDDYTWHMLSNAFLCHRGFQLPKRRDIVRKAQIRRNTERFGTFRKEVYARYNKKAEDYESKKRKGILPYMNHFSDTGEMPETFFTKAPPLEKYAGINRRI